MIGDFTNFTEDSLLDSAYNIIFTQRILYFFPLLIFNLVEKDTNNAVVGRRRSDAKASLILL